MEREILEGVFSPKEFWVVEKDADSGSPLIFVFALAPRTGHADGSKVEKHAQPLQFNVAILAIAWPSSHTSCSDFITMCMQVRVSAELRVQMGAAYPDEAPEVVLSKCRGLTEADAGKVGLQGCLLLLILGISCTVYISDLGSRS